MTISLPECCETTPDLLDAAASTFGDKVFVDDNGLTYSFNTIRQQCRRVAAALIASGFNAGDRAAIWAPNIHQWVTAALAIQYAGGVLVTINTRYKGAEAAQILRSGQVSTLFCIGHFLDQDYPGLLAEQSLPDLHQTIVIGQSSVQTQTTWDDFCQQGEDYLAQHGPELVDRRARAVQANDISDLLFTSGTTGSPKGVMTAHGQNLATFRQWTEILGLNADDRYLVINPFFHSFGYKAGILACLMRGATLLPHQVFDADIILARIQHEAITVLPGPPTLFQSLLASPNRQNFDLSSLAKATTGAAVIPVELISRMRGELGIDTVISAYGLTESCGLVTMCHSEDSAKLIATTSGQALPDTEVHCMDSAGKLLAAGETGEIVVRGFNVMRGYFNDPQATADTIDADGWLHTGDSGVLDDNGYLTITDRLKDMFITGGFNCYPAEIENILGTHADVVMCAVIGIADERQGEVAMAWVVLTPGSSLTAEALITWSRTHMANFKVPRNIRFVTELPLNASGKVLKNELRIAAQTAASSAAKVPLN